MSATASHTARDRLSRISDSVENALSRGTLVLPTLPEVAISIGHMMRREDVDAALIAREVMKDPGIASGLLKAANSAAVGRAGKRVDSIPLAIARLGYSATQVLVNRLAMAQMFQARSPLLMHVLRQSWAESIEVAALSKALAQYCTKLSPDTAMLAGLVHQVGVLPIALMIDQQPDLIENELQLREAMTALHPQIAQRVLAAWTFPDELHRVPAEATNADRFYQGPADYADVVNVSILQLAASQTKSEGVDKRTTSASFSRLGLNPEIEVLEIPKISEARQHNLELLAG